jgi:hypothetical protein
VQLTLGKNSHAEKTKNLKAGYWTPVHSLSGVAGVMPMPIFVCATDTGILDPHQTCYQFAQQSSSLLIPGNYCPIK